MWCTQCHTAFSWKSGQIQTRVHNPHYYEWLRENNSNNNVPCHFQFSYTGILGGISNHYVPVDESYENTMMLFPSKLMHCVYPFFTSDDYRISVAGNVYCTRKNSTTK